MPHAGFCRWLWRGITRAKEARTIDRRREPPSGCWNRSSDWRRLTRVSCAAQRSPCRCVGVSVLVCVWERRATVAADMPLVFGGCRQGNFVCRSRSSPTESRTHPPAHLTTPWQAMEVLSSRGKAHTVSGDYDSITNCDLSLAHEKRTLFAH